MNLYSQGAVVGDMPPGLMSRRMFRIDRGRVVIEEEWKIDVPGCPMIRNPWTNPLLVSEGSRYVRQVEMSEQEFESAEIKLFN